MRNQEELEHPVTLAVRNDRGVPDRLWWEGHEPGQGWPDLANKISDNQLNSITIITMNYYYYFQFKYASCNIGTYLYKKIVCCSPEFPI